MTHLSEPHGSGVGIAEAGLRKLVNLKYSICTVYVINLVFDTTIVNLYRTKLAYPMDAGRCKDLSFSKSEHSSEDLLQPERLEKGGPC